MFSWEVQVAVHARLSDYAPLAARLAAHVEFPNQPAVYDFVPESARLATGSREFPYITVDQASVVTFDTDTSVGSETVVTIHTWSRFRGMEEVKLIHRDIYDALHRYALNIGGAHTVLCDWMSADATIDPDGKTRHGVTRVRVIAEQP